ncbi:V-type ATP synthase subunit E [Alkalibacter mobilis]|uniref:V-type ATP synthase subunit E n=1 Tax=Alkalibacter mobilis TaxID=2787712 RepID=UPI00189D4973|nr:V-type ATP synthase subunit E [Alkalibacter mobilis]MBF7096558.1 V-type ATP synthase subunit E [Alkalibacter mobilis]
MITVEDKIRTFSKYVYEKELKIKEDVLSETKARLDRIVEEKQKEILEKCSTLETKQKKKIELEAQKKISQAKLKARDEVFEVKNMMMEDLISLVNGELRSFTESSEYEEWLIRLLDSNFTGDHDWTKVYLVLKDLENYAGRLNLKYPKVDFLEMDNSNIGGAVLESSKGTEKKDLSLKTRLDESHNEIGLLLQESWEKGDQ